MKVKITYAVDFDKVPAKMSELISEKLDEYDGIVKKHKNCVDLLRTSTSTNAYKTVLEMLHELRMSLSEIDQSLGDCASVIEGYVHAVETQAEQPESEPVFESQPPQAPPPENLSEDK